MASVISKTKVGISISQTISVHVDCRTVTTVVRVVILRLCNHTPSTLMPHSGCSGVVVEYCIGLVTREVVGSTHTRSTASNLEQVANLLCAQASGQLSPLPSTGREMSSSYGYGVKA